MGTISVFGGIDMNLGSGLSLVRRNELHLGIEDKIPATK
jgi:hypothetical protein